MNEGSKNGRWKGGRVISSGGYVLQRCEGHPRATKKGLYVFEHILMMEGTLGRYLIPGEIIHHKNHLKTDNRLKNLELTTAKEHFHKHPKPEGFGFKKGVKHSDQHRKRVSEAKKRWWAAKKAARNKTN